MSVVAFQILEEDWQVYVAKEVDVAHVVSCPSVFSSSVPMILDLVVVLCKSFVTKMATGRSCEIYFPFCLL